MTGPAQVPAETCPGCGEVFHPHRPGTGQRCRTCEYWDAGQFAPVAPLHEAPTGDYVDYGRRDEALSHALRGVEMGGYDELTKARWVRNLDLADLRVLVSWLERVRRAGMLACVELEAELQERNSRYARERAYGAGVRSGPASGGPTADEAVWAGWSA